jgi:hypothetical protein
VGLFLESVNQILKAQLDIERHGGPSGGDDRCPYPVLQSMWVWEGR